MRLPTCTAAAMQPVGACGQKTHAADTTSRLMRTAIEGAERGRTGCTFEGVVQALEASTWPPPCFTILHRGAELLLSIGYGCGASSEASSSDAKGRAVSVPRCRTMTRGELRGKLKEDTARGGDSGRAWPARPGRNAVCSEPVGGLSVCASPRGDQLEKGNRRWKAGTESRRGGNSQ
jgi:hypothetical protein